jgi:Family of unknown function (DUF6279)
MNSLRDKFFPYLSIACLVFLISACSSLQLTYNQSDLLLKWWIDDYIDTTEDQNNFLTQAFPPILAKHRQEQLPKFLAEIRKLREQLTKPLSISDAQIVVKEIKTASLDTLNVLNEDASKLALALEPKQFSNMESAFVKANKKYQNEYLTGNAEERLQVRVDKIIERTESFSGSISKSQKAQIKEIAKENLLDGELIYQIRLFKQQHVLKTLQKIHQEKPTLTQTKTITSKLFQDLVWGANPEQMELERKRDLQSAIVIAKISEILDMQQLKKSQNKLRSWEVDLQKLIQQK